MTKNITTHVLAAALILSFTLLIPSAALAQTTDRVSGTVVDESGGVIAGAQVLLRDMSGALLQRVATDIAGNFAFSGLPNGRYQIEVEKNLFDPASLTTQVVPGTAAQPLRVVMSVAGKTESISVDAPKVDERPTGQIVTSVDQGILKEVTGFSLGEVVTYSPGVTYVQGNGPRDVVISVRGSNTRSTFGIRGVQMFDDGFPVTQPDGLSRSDLNDPHAYGQIDVERGLRLPFMGITLLKVPSISIPGVPRTSTVWRWVWMPAASAIAMPT